MSFREKVENNIVIFFIGTLISGFVSGVCVYEKILNTFNYKILSEDKLERMQEEKERIIAEKEKLNEKFQGESKIFKEDIQTLKEENTKLKGMYINARRQLSNLGKIRTSDIDMPLAALEEAKNVEEEKRKIQREGDEIAKQLQEQMKVGEKHQKESQKKINDLKSLMIWIGVIVVLVVVICGYLGIG